MKELRRKFDRFCFRNRNKGIPNLMLYVAIGTGIVYLINGMDPSQTLYQLLAFDPDLILRGQIWRLVTYPLLDGGLNLFWTALLLLCYYSLGRAIESIWGTFRFNLYYFMGIALTDLVCLVLHIPGASTFYLNMSLFLAYATLFPDARFTLFLIIPVPAWVLAVIDLLTIFAGIFSGFPFGLIPLVAIANYFLFFGKDWVRVFPVSWRINAKRAARKATNPRAKTIPFNAAGSYQATHATVKAPYTHKCTVCGRTDVDSPDLQFRYCSRCKGYHCYCEDHISNHAHITE